MAIELRVGTLECKKEIGGRNRYQILHRPDGVGGYVVLYIDPRPPDEAPDFVTVGDRPWKCKQNGLSSRHVWAFARACARLIRRFDYGDRGSEDP